LLVAVFALLIWGRWRYDLVGATGGTALIRGGIAGLAHGASPVVVLCILMVVTVTLSDLLNNTATAVIAAPVALDIAARLLGASPAAGP
jgi:di/tricarboxylate transporter